MKKFTKILEELENGKFYKIKAEVELILPCDNEGESGYMSDSILSSLEYCFDYTIINIEETDERIDEGMELYQGKQGQGGKDNTDEEKIEKTWIAEFGDRAVNTDEKMEFYHRMREAGIDGRLVFSVLKDKFGF